MNDDPIVYTIRDRISWLVGMLMTASFTLANFALR
jgi:hypothetical protein